jgi:hypothetical protein
VPVTDSAERPPVAARNAADLLAGTWVVEKAKNGCAGKFGLEVSSDGKKLIFIGSSPKKVVILPFEVVQKSNPTLATKDYEYEVVAPDKIKVTNRVTGSVTEVEKCDQ